MKYIHGYYDEEKKIPYGGEEFLFVYNTNGTKKLKGENVIKGKVIKWKNERESSGKRRFISEIEMLSQLIKKDKKYKEIQKGLCQKIFDDKNYRTFPTVC